MATPRRLSPSKEALSSLSRSGYGDRSPTFAIRKLTDELDTVRRAWREEGSELRTKMVRCCRNADFQSPVQEFFHIFQ